MTFISISKTFHKNFQFQFWINLNFETLSSTKTKTEFLFIQCNQNQKICAISEKAEKLNFCLITLSKQNYSLRENLKRTIAIAIPGLRSLNRTLGIFLLSFA